jgi:hypothetical protein
VLLLQEEEKTQKAATEVPGVQKLARLLFSPSRVPRRPQNMSSAKNRHAKVGKMGHKPGDISRSDKIRMMESSGPVQVAWWTVPAGAVKSWQKEQRARAKVRVKRRLDREMRETME